MATADHFYTNPSPGSLYAPRFRYRGPRERLKWNNFMQESAAGLEQLGSYLILIDAFVQDDLAAQFSELTSAGRQLAAHLSVNTMHQTLP